ncbi:MAG: hypothetical protein HOP32_14465 [Nitrospira sp.]|nr:hypothetical protein [Nitrospira sp.]
MKWFLTIIGILILVAGLVAGFFGAPTWLMTIALGGLIALLIAANLNSFSEFKVSESGIEAKMREARQVITRAESTLSELQLLARNVAEVTLSLVKRSGRIGGYADGEQDKIKTSVLEVLKKIGVPEADIPSILRDWNRFIEFDYAHFILGGNTIPDTKSDALMQDWRSLRDGGIVKIPTPQDIRSFIIKHNLMSPTLDGYLNDYEHFLAHKEHKRPEVWAERERWGRLKSL